ncbi:hypothetical protein NPX13_g9471 [Xylaria arbuscula]|uniref:Heterokaryon incompatibility domain-containing protein n=1 Tax=Xylaria arbuscula TaxID=114810 RepID=A0A9W8N6N0_9PEZI|nr:hypothetical protein NPX13_g9471 [Xylaria arbuscula]
MAANSNPDSPNYGTHNINVSGRPLAPSNGDICDECERIDFGALVSDGCLSCRPAFAGGERLVLGTLQRRKEHKSCPGCTLVVSCIDSFYGRVQPPLASKITLREFMDEYQPFGSIQGRDEYSGVRALQVIVCSRGLDNERPREKLEAVGLIVPQLLDEESLGKPPIQQELFTAQYQPYQSPRNVKDHIDTNLVQAWLERCLAHHGDTCKQYLTPRDSGVAIRLIDVEEMKLCRATLQERYLALSYVWGQYTKPVLVKSTESLLSQPAGISIELLPKTIADAIELTRRLGQRFLWVDSVCIIQDSEADKRSQLSLMDSIYSLAEIVIVTADSNTANSGLKGVLDRRNTVVRPTVFVQGHEFTTASLTLAKRLSTSVWNSRGWTFQEGLLARRLLVIFDSQIYWSCHTAAYCEDMFTEFDNANPAPTYHNSLFGAPPTRACYDQTIPDGSSSPCHAWDYAGKVETFMSRQFTNPSDAFFAFHTVPGGDGKPQNILFPSWSWFAKGCNLHYDTCGDWIVSKVTWHEPIPYRNSYEVPKTCSCGRIYYSKPTILGHPDGSKSECGQRTSDFGYLQFDAQTAILTIEFLGMAERPLLCEHELQTQVWANLLLPDNNCIGLIKCPNRIFASSAVEGDRLTVQPGDKVEAEFVHLSTHGLARDVGGKILFCEEHDVVKHKGRSTHVPGCDFAANVNLMMIRWDDDHKVAFRVGITRVQEAGWAKVETRQQRIVLG